jgi:dihydropteroate synthase
VQLFGVVNASPDSLHEESRVEGPEAALARARLLLAAGADAIDVGGQGSTDVATVVDWQLEWERLAEVIPALATLGVDVSVDTWKPEVARRALGAGATVLNAADGMQSETMWEVAAEFDVPTVVPFLSGPDPRRMARVDHDPVGAMIEFFAARLTEADRFGMRRRCILDPGTGFAPPNWPWDERYLYQWKRTPQHDELLEIVVAQQPEFGRAHHPGRVRAVERQLGVG